MRDHDGQFADGRSVIKTADVAADRSVIVNGDDHGGGIEAEDEQI